MTNYLIKKFIDEDSTANEITKRRKYGILSGVVGIICNVILSIGKFIAGIITGSIAISADAFNNLSDAISSVVTLICFKTSDSPADKDHPFGYGRIEYISGLIVSIAIIFMGIEFTKSSVEKIFSPEPVSEGLLPVIILIFSLIIKLWLGNFNNKIGEIINSTAMKATAFDSIGDAIITITILIGMAITHFTGISVDAYTGIFVAIFIIFTGISMIKETISQLLGESPSPEIVKGIKNIVMASPQVIGIHDLIVHNYGPGRIVVSLHAEMPANKSITELHEEIDTLEKQLKNKFNCQAVIHIDPITTDDDSLNETREKLSQIIKLVHKSAKIYDLRIVPGKHQTLRFHVAVPYDVPQTDNDITEAISKSVKSINPDYKCTIDIDRIYFEIEESENDNDNN